MAFPYCFMKRQRQNTELWGFSLHPGAFNSTSVHEKEPSKGRQWAAGLMRLKRGMQFQTIQMISPELLLSVPLWPGFRL